VLTAGALVGALADDDGYDVVYVHCLAVGKKRVVAATEKAARVWLVVDLFGGKLLDVNGRFHIYARVGARQAPAQKRCCKGAKVNIFSHALP